MFQDWLNLYKAMRESSVNQGGLVCPECGSQSVDVQYVGDEIKRIGYLDMWCTSCNKGVHFSRVSIPEGVDFISFAAPDEMIAARIPNFEQVVPLD